MDGLGHELLPHAAFAENEHRAARRGHLKDLVPHPPHPRRPAHQIADEILAAQLVLKMNGAVARVPPLQDALQPGTDLGLLQGTHQVVVGAVLEGVDGASHGVFGREHQDRRDGRVGAEPGHDVLVSVPDQRRIQERHVEILPCRKIERCGGCRDRAHVHPQPPEHELHFEALGRIDQQDVLAVDEHREPRATSQSVTLAHFCQQTNASEWPSREICGPGGAPRRVNPARSQPATDRFT